MGEILDGGQLGGAEGLGEGLVAPRQAAADGAAGGAHEVGDGAEGAAAVGEIASVQRAPGLALEVVGVVVGHEEIGLVGVGELLAGDGPAAEAGEVVPDGLVEEVGQGPGPGLRRVGEIVGAEAEGDSGQGEEGAAAQGLAVVDGTQRFADGVRGDGLDVHGGGSCG